MANKEYIYMLKKTYYRDARPYQDEDESEGTVLYKSFDKAVEVIQNEYNKKINHPDLEMKGIEIDKDNGRASAFITIQTYKSTYSVFTQYTWELSREEIKWTSKIL